MEHMRWDQEGGCFVVGDGTSNQDTFAIASVLNVSLASIRRALAKQAGVSIPPLTSLPSPRSYGSYLELSESLSRGPQAEITIDKISDYSYLSSSSLKRRIFAPTSQLSIRQLLTRILSLRSRKECSVECVSSS